MYIILAILVGSSNKPVEAVSSTVYVSNYDELQAAIDGQEEGSNIILANDITIYKNIVIDKNITLNGNFHTIFMEYDSNQTDEDRANMIYIGNGANVTIENITLNGRFANNTGNCIGIRGKDSDNTSNVLIRNSTVIRAFKQGICLDENSNITILNSNINENNGAAIFGKGINVNIYIENTNIQRNGWNNPQRDLGLEGTIWSLTDEELEETHLPNRENNTSAIVLPHNTQLQMLNSYVMNNGGHGIEVGAYWGQNQGSKAEIIGCYIGHNNWSGVFSEQDSSRVIISGGWIRYNNNAGIELDRCSSDSKIENAEIFGNGYTGISLRNNSQVTVTGCNITVMGQIQHTAVLNREWTTVENDAHGIEIFDNGICTLNGTTIKTEIHNKYVLPPHNIGTDQYDPTNSDISSIHKYPYNGKLDVCSIAIATENDITVAPLVINAGCTIEGQINLDSDTAYIYTTEVTRTNCLV